MSMSLDGLYNQYSDLYTSASAKNSASADKLKDTLSKTDYSKSNDDELMEVCREFESYFIEQAYKALEKWFLRVRKAAECQHIWTISVIC